MFDPCITHQFQAESRPSRPAFSLAAAAGACRHNDLEEASMDRMDAVVIGAGVVGLAVARALALQGREVLVVEEPTPLVPARARATAKSFMRASITPPAP
jgi:NADPH-dependent 2,4-dienoyl-CoA reductase/sulfur reductase-like enzyme